LSNQPTDRPRNPFFQLVWVPKPGQASRLPYTIRTIIEQMGGSGLRGAMVYVGASTRTYKCPRVEGECRPDYPSRRTENGEGLIDYQVGLSFKVNGKRGQGWTMIVAYEADDTYTVWLWKRIRRPRYTGQVGEVLAEHRGVYCDQLKSTVEQTYDEAIRQHCGGFIPLS
jgi:hypothetical protein